VLATPALADWQLRIIGPDEDGHAETLRPLIERLGPSPRITLEGPADDAAKAAAFARAQAFILPSLSENFGIAVAEALAHGLPAITTTGTPWADLPVTGAGWHCPPDAASLAKTLMDALALPPAALAAMGARGRAHVAARYGWPHIAAQSLAFYEWLLHGGTKPDFVET
jgi:glycosyltransferase involved in cell wall biosynthesis